MEEPASENVAFDLCLTPALNAHYVGQVGGYVVIMIMRGSGCCCVAGSLTEFCACRGCIFRHMFEATGKPTRKVAAFCDGDALLPYVV